jgi:hypothetical protein
MMRIGEGLAVAIIYGNMVQRVRCWLTLTAGRT